MPNKTTYIIRDELGNVVSDDSAYEIGALIDALDRGVLTVELWHGRELIEVRPYEVKVRMYAATST